MGFIERLGKVRGWINRTRAIEEEIPAALIRAFENVREEPKSRVFASSLVDIILPILDARVGTIPFLTEQMRLRYFSKNEDGRLIFTGCIARKLTDFNEGDRIEAYGTDEKGELDIYIYRNKLRFRNNWELEAIEFVRPGSPFKHDYRWSFAREKEEGASRRYSIKDIKTK